MKTFLRLFFLLMCVSVFAQEDFSHKSSSQDERSIRPLRIGLKLGVPDIGSLNAEYVTPLLENRVAVSLDFISLGVTIGDEKLSMNNFEFGSNVYLKTSGKGLYGGISYSSFKSDITMSDVSFTNGTVGDGKAAFNYGTFNVKIGVKLGRTVYFRSELGYGFGKVPEYITLTGAHPSQVSLEKIPKIPGIGTGGTLIFNLGFGIGFL